MKDFGDSIRLAEEESSGTLMAMCLKASGLMTRPMDTEFIRILMVPGMKDTGSKTCSMDLVRRSGPTDQDTKGTIIWAKSTEKVLILGQMDQSTTVTGSKIELRAMGTILGWMVADTQDSGWTTICTDKANINGVTDVVTKAITNTTRNTDTEYTSGPMVENTKVTGPSVNNTAKVNTF